MTRTSFLFRVDSDNGVHVRVSMFAGPDEQHRAHNGTLVFRPQEWADFTDRIVGPGYTITSADPQPEGAVDHHA
jgi:hypothetical protein